MEENTPQVWDKLWHGIPSSELQNMVETERLGIRWQRIRKLILKKLSSMDGLRTIEIGAGTGTFSVLMAQEGCQVTIVDYSLEALDASKEMFRLHSVEASWLCQNALELPDHLRGRYDIAMSFGTAEHFKGDERVKFIKAHVDLIRPGGLAIISVPNAYNLPYRIWKWKLEKQGRWDAGEEYPFTRKELLQICNKYSWQDVSFLGDSLVASFRYVNFLHPKRIVKKLLRLPSSQRISPRKMRLERGTPLDAFLSYALTLVIRKI